MTTALNQRHSMTTHIGERNAAPATPRSRTPRSRYLTLNGATMVSIAAVALTIIGILYLVQTSHVASLGYESSRLQTQQYELGLETSALQSEVARYESLGTIEDVAVGQLDMTPLQNHEFLTVEAPAQQELPPVEAEPRPAESLFDRIGRSVLGIGKSDSAAAVPNTGIAGD